jgi:hypothetical protein
MPAPKKPTDRQAKAEARSQFIELDFDGDHYVIDRENADNLELMEFTEDGQYIKAIRGYVGADQWAKFKDSQRDDKGRVTVESFEAFLNAVMEAIGGN